VKNCTQIETCLVWVPSWKLLNIKGADLGTPICRAHTQTHMCITFVMNYKQSDFPTIFSEVHCIYTTYLPVKRHRNFWGILGVGILYTSPNTGVVEATALETSTYSFTYVEHSQYVVLIRQENRCVDRYIVVKCRHHISEVVKTIFLEHLQIQKILAHSPNGL
jgi:hypothetical protein